MASAPIGEIEDLKGTVRATHTDGVVVELQEGDPVFQGDVLETASDSAIGIRFADGTTLGLDGDAQIVLDEMVYNPDGDSGSMVFSLIKGAMVFVSGEIAATGPDAMMIKTPAATIGIRGTKSGLLVDVDGNVFIDLFTWYSVIAAWNEQNEWQIDADNPLLAFSGDGTPFVPLNADLIHATLFGAERVLPPQPGDPYDETKEDLQGRLTDFKAFLVDFFGGGIEGVLSTQVPLDDPASAEPVTFIPFLDEDDIILPPENRPPEAFDDDYAATEDTTLSVAAGPGVLDNDFDPDNDDFTVTGNSEPAHGELTVAADGSFTYTPDPGFDGTDSFTYTITDENGLTDSATVTITVADDDPPDAVDDDYNMTDDTTLIVAAGDGLLDNDSDPDGDGFTVTENSDPSHGVVSVDADGSFTYTPTLGFAGTDSFTYTITDDNGLTDSATVTITVADDDPPEAFDDDYSMTDDTTLIVAAGDGLLDNDSDPDGDSFTVTDNSDPSHGAVTVADDGSFTYTPTLGFAGTDSFTYTITDDNGLTDSATVKITVADDDPPDAVDDDYNMTDDTTLIVAAGDGLLDNDSDPDGDGFTVTDNSDPSHGVVSVDADGSFTYTPTLGFAGTDSFTYTITDDNGLTDSATVKITVADDDPPDAVDDDYSMTEDTTLSVAAGDGLLDNDSDPDGDGFTVTDNTTASHGAVSVAPDGSFTYTPDPGFDGTDSFTYTITDENGLTDSATVKITVVDDKLLVGDNDDNVTNPAATVSTIDPYDEVAGDSPRLQGGIGDDILLGDIGGTSQGFEVTTFEDQNAVVVLDRSGSMNTGGRLAIAKDAIRVAADSYATYAAQAKLSGVDVVVKFTVIPFSNDAGTPLVITLDTSVIDGTPGNTFDDFFTEISPGVFEFDQTMYAGFYAALGLINATGSTDYQDALDAALSSFLSSNGASSSFDIQPLDQLAGGFDNNTLLFLTDGAPSSPLTFRGTDDPDQGSSSTGLDHWRGLWTALGVEAHGINIVLTGSADTNLIDNTGGTDVVANLEDVDDAIQRAIQFVGTTDDTVGADVLNGGAGNDVIFGDSVNTDSLAQSSVDGDGYAALLRQVAVAEGEDPATYTPTVEEVRAFILDPLNILHVDNDPRGGADTIDAGDGNDTVFGQGGGDDITGGDGADLLDGGTGGDTIIADAVQGVGDGDIDTLIGGKGSDFLHGADADVDIFVWRAGHRGEAGAISLTNSGTTVTNPSDNQIVLAASLTAANVDYFRFEVTETTAVTFDGKSSAFDMEFFLFADTDNDGDVETGEPLISFNDNDANSEVTDADDYGQDSDGSAGGTDPDEDPFIVQGQLAPGFYVLAVGGSGLTETEARDQSDPGNTEAGAYQVTVTGENITLIGGTGLTETFTTNPTDDVDTVTGFTVASDGDILDLSDLLVGAPVSPTKDNLNDFFNVTEVGGDTRIDVDFNGSADSATFDTQLTIVLDGVVTGLSEAEFLDQLLTNNQLVV